MKRDRYTEPQIVFALQEAAPRSRGGYGRGTVQQRVRPALQSVLPGGISAAPGKPSRRVAQGSAMQPRWHIAFRNVTFTEYAGVSYADYYASPATMLEAQLAARGLLERVVEAQEHVAGLSAGLARRQYTGMGYTGEDYSALLSPAVYRAFAVPFYNRLYAGSKQRSVHSELLRAERLRTARAEVGTTEFHGAGSVNLTLQEQYGTMGERIREFAGCGCVYVQLYPGRGTRSATWRPPSQPAATSAPAARPGMPVRSRWACRLCTSRRPPVAACRRASPWARSRR